MANLYHLFYLAVLILIVSAVVYLVRTGKGVSRVGGRRRTRSVLEAHGLQSLMTELISRADARVFFMEIDLTRTRDEFYVTRDDSGLHLQVEPKSSPTDEVVANLQRLASREGLTLVADEGSFPEITIPPGTAEPEAIAYRLFRGAYDVKDEDPVEVHFVIPEE